MRWLFYLPLIFLLACTPAGEKAQTPKQSDSSAVLRLYATQQFRTSGLERTVLEDFTKKHKCSVEVRLFDDASQLIKAIASQPDSIDVVFGLPDSFASSDSLNAHFLPYLPAHKDALNRVLFTGHPMHLTPYGFSYLSVIYNSSLTQPPTSFGQLQDDRFIKQITVLNPKYSGPGRATVHWIVSLFGDRKSTRLNSSHL